MPADWSVTPQDQAPISITSFSPEALWFGPRLYGSGPAPAAWPGQYRCFFVPFIVSLPYTVQMMGIYNGATISGNFDIGVYDDQQNQIVASGSTAQSGASGLQAVTITTTTLDPGVYYMALVFDNTTATVYSATVTSSQSRSMGVLSQTLTSVTLPSSATWVVTPSGQVPLMVLSSQSLI